MDNQGNVKLNFGGSHEVKTDNDQRTVSGGLTVVVVTHEMLAEIKYRWVLKSAKHQGVKQQSTEKLKLIFKELTEYSFHN